MRKSKFSRKINKLDTTSDTITGRGGLVLFSRYLENIGIFDLLEKEFGFFRKSSKGLPIWLLFKQVFCFLFDGTSRHLTYFNHLKKDEGYAAAIEIESSHLASSHIIKRFFKPFAWWYGKKFQSILLRMFIWRLKISNPEEIVLYLDAMVLNNDDALNRQGVQPTYKKVKGFQGLNIIWNGKIINSVFRGGSKNGNCGNTALNMVTDLVNLIRSEYSATVPIILRCDSGFLDEKNFLGFDKLNIAFIASGKMYESVKEYVSSSQKENWNIYKNKNHKWNFIEFGFRCSKWKRFFRAFYTHCIYEEKQMLFEFARPDNVILTNIGINTKVLENCTEERKQYWLNPETIIGSYHQCGADELAHRGLKDFGFEQLPFKRFGHNSALYYCMLISFFLFETFKEDVTREVIPIKSYATTLRRKIVDIAAKIVYTSHEIIIKVSKSTMQAITFEKLWYNSLNPTPIL